MDINLLTPLYLLAIYGSIRIFAKTTHKDINQVNWSAFESVCVTLALYFGAQFVAGIALFVIGSLRGISGNELSNWLTQSVLVQFVFVVLVEFLVIWWLRAFLKKRAANFKTIGLNKPRVQDIGWTLIGFGIYFVLFIVISLAIKALIPSLAIDQNQQIGFEGAQGAYVALVFISLVVLPPLVEEILIRGFLYSGLKKALPKIWAVLITSGLFAVAHLQAGNGEPLLWIAAIDTFTLSLVLIYLREKTGGLWASIGLHTIKNFIAFLVLFVFVH